MSTQAKTVGVRLTNDERRYIANLLVRTGTMRIEFRDSSAELVVPAVQRIELGDYRLE